MNFISLSLIFLVITLSISPCCTESDNCLNDTEINCENHEQEERESAHLPCSPFYSCGNCLGFFFEEKNEFKFIIFFSDNNQKKSFYLDYMSVGYNIILLKPPKRI